MKKYKGPSRLYKGLTRSKSHWHVHFIGNGEHQRDPRLPNIQHPECNHRGNWKRWKLNQQIRQAERAAAAQNYETPAKLPEGPPPFRYVPPELDD